MNPYNQNDELIVINENFINGYLSPIALLKDYTTSEVGFNFYFKRMTDNSLVEDSLHEEFRNSFKRFTDNKGNRYKTDAQVETLINQGIQLTEIKNWEKHLHRAIDCWTGSTLTNTIKEERKSSGWTERPHLLSLDLTELLKVFFYPKKMKAFTYDGPIMSDLYYHWGGINWLDILFSNQEENYILHFDLSD